MLNQNHQHDSNGKSQAPALHIQNLGVEYRTADGVVHAVNGLDLTIERGTTLGLVGETGAGKTTTALSILRLLAQPVGKIVSGDIELDGESLFEKSEQQMGHIRGKQVSMIFQDPMTSLNPVITVEQQIAEVIAHHMQDEKRRPAQEADPQAEPAGAPDTQKQPAPAAPKSKCAQKRGRRNEHEAVLRARKMLETVGIPAERGCEYPHQFSGGMKQRVVIAMALACSPQLLIADEPTTALDVTIQAQVLEMMRKLRQKYRMSMLMITHDLGIVAETCDNVAVIYAGRIVERGTLEDVFEHTLHPYTRGLFASLPNLEDRTARLQPIPGLMPDPCSLPTGCAFCLRCAHATERCATEPPSRVYRNEEHYVECHLYDSSNITKEGAVNPA